MTAISAIPGARISDRVGRKPVIWAAAVIAGIGLLGVAVAPTPAFAIASFVPFGIGMGAFLSVDWALMTDVIPKHTSGRYMGILNAGTAMAEPVFLIIAGPLALDLLGRLLGEPLGARSTMIVAVLFLVGSGLALFRVDARRRELDETVGEPRASSRRMTTHRADARLMDAARERARRTGPRELSVAVTPRYRFVWGLNRRHRADAVRRARHRARALARAAVPARREPPQRLRPDARAVGGARRAAHHLVRPARGRLQPRVQESAAGLRRRRHPVQPGEDDADLRRARGPPRLRGRWRARHLRRGAHRLPRERAAAVRGRRGRLRGDLGRAGRPLRDRRQHRPLVPQAHRDSLRRTHPDRCRPRPRGPDGARGPHSRGDPGHSCRRPSRACRGAGRCRSSPTC